MRSLAALSSPLFTTLASWRRRSRMRSSNSLKYSLSDFPEGSVSVTPTSRSFKETLIKFSLSTARSDKVAPDELPHQAEDTGNDDRLLTLYQEDAAGGVSGRDESGGAV